MGGPTAKKQQAEKQQGGSRMPKLMVPKAWLLATKAKAEAGKVLKAFQRANEKAVPDAPRNYHWCAAIRSGEHLAINSPFLVSR